MRASNLPTLHKFLGNGWQLRTELAKAISSVQTYAKKGKTDPAARAKLSALLTAAQAELTAVGNYPKSLALTAADTALSLGSDTSEQCVATVTEIDGGTRVVTGDSKTVYTSSNPAVATVSAGGLVTAVAVGSVTISAQYEDAVGTRAFTVAAE